MKTADILTRLSDKHIAYLRQVANAIINMDATGHKDVAECYKYTARGYIKALIDSDVIGQDEFRGVWAWFTILLDR